MPAIVPPPHRLRGLYPITPDNTDTGALLAQVAAILPHAAMLQYRNKTASPELRFEQALRLQELCQHHGVPLIINDDYRLCERVRADGVHLGRQDGDVRIVRERLGRHAIIGVSCYDDFLRARDAVAQGASYVAFGAIYSSPTKPEAVHCPLDVLTRARNELGVPVAAIGGITVERLPQLIAAGCDLAAVITDLFKAPDPIHRARTYQALFEQE